MGTRPDNPVPGSRKFRFGQRPMLRFPFCHSGHAILELERPPGCCGHPCRDAHTFSLGGGHHPGMDIWVNRDGELGRRVTSRHWPQYYRSRSFGGQIEDRRLSQPRT